MLESDIKKLTVAVVQLTEALHLVRLPAAAAAPTKTSAPVAIPDATKTETVSAPVPTPTPAGDAFAAAAGKSVAAADATVDTAAALAEAAAAEEVAALAGGVPDAKPPTKKVLIEKFILLAQTKDRAVAIKLLADFGVANLPELTDKTKWIEFVAECDRLLAA